MRAFISAGLFSLFVIVACGSSSIAADTPPSDTLPSDAVIQQRMVGTWRMNWIAFRETITIGTNGDYVAYRSPQDRREGKIEIRDGLWIDTRKSSDTNQPVPHVAPNVIIRVTDHELLYRAQNGSQPILLEKVTR